MAFLPSPSSEITVHLTNKSDNLWQQLFNLDHEMILTVAGRRIFPTLEYTVSGLNPSKTYSMCFHLEQVDDKKLRYTNKCWIESQSSESRDTPRKVWHLNGAQTGEEWMKRSLTFDQVRITNKKSKEQGNASYIHLHTQHRYIPVLSIFEINSETGAVSTTLVSQTTIAKCLFITVTAYHNPEVNTFKTNVNPYSTGSRKDRRRERQSVSPTSSACSSEDASSEASISPSPAKKSRTSSVSSPIPNPVSFSPAPALPALPALPSLPAMPEFNPFMLQAYLLSQMYKTMPMYPSPFTFMTPPAPIAEETEEDVEVV